MNALNPKFPIATLAAILLLAVSSRAANEDPVFKTIQAELTRSMDALQLPDSPKPYYIDCAFTLSESASAGASLGGLTGSGTHRNGHLSVSVRVGDYKLDNTNFSGNMMWGGWSELDSPMPSPIDGDCEILRRGIWWAVDSAYKDAVENLKRKKTVLLNKSLPPVADDFAKVPANTYVADAKPAALPELAGLSALVCRYSAALREHNVLQKGNAALSIQNQQRWYVNTEGTRTYSVLNQASCNVVAVAQADDGVMVADGLNYVQRSFAALPAPEEIEREVKALGARVAAMRSAPLLDDFAGPVLFEGEAAPAICQRVLAARFGSRREPIQEGRGWGGDQKSLRRKLGRRVMATTFSVADDPTIDVFEGVPLFGKAVVDLEGVAAQRVQLVRDGILKALLTTRTPDKRLPDSNGHAFAQSWGWSRSAGNSAAITNLIITCKDGLEPQALRAKFLETIKEQDVEYGLIVRRIPAPGSASGYGGRIWYGGGGADEIVISEPLYAFRVFKDGKEELVRAVNLKGIGMASFKDILAAGKQLYGKHDAAGHGLQSVIAPALLFEEGIVEKPEGNVAKPPRLPSPMLAQGD